MSTQESLFPDENRGYPDGTMVDQVKASVEALHSMYEVPPHRRYLIQTAVELARNIEAGNRKGRAIANEALQLADVLAKLEEGVTPEETVESTLHPEVTEFMNALGRLPTAADPQAGHTAGS